MKESFICILVLITHIFCISQTSEIIPFEHTPLEKAGDLSAKMVAQIHDFLLGEMNNVRSERIASWEQALAGNHSSDFIAAKRQFLLQQLGIRGLRDQHNLRILLDPDAEGHAGTTDISVQSIQWQVKDGILSEGLMLTPPGTWLASAIVIPDADTPPEMLVEQIQESTALGAIAYRMAALGCRVLIPALINRDTVHSGSEMLNKWTNQPHREWLHKQAYELGRHLIGDELEKVFSLVDYLSQKGGDQDAPIMVMGYGEGGLLAAFAGALDTRIDGTLCSGYFNAWENTYREPLYRNIHGILQEIGAAELAMMHAPRKLVIEHSQFPEIENPHHVSPWQTAASPGIIQNPQLEEFMKEYHQVLSYVGDNSSHVSFFNTMQRSSGQAFAPYSIDELTKGLGLIMTNSSSDLALFNQQPFLDQRQERMVKNLESVYQKQIERSELERNEIFWRPMQDPDEEHQDQIRENYREALWENLGRLPQEVMDGSGCQARFLASGPSWNRYEITLPVLGGVFAWGIITIPNDLKAGQKLPLVVCQHGLEGLPQDVVTTDTTDPKFVPYQGFATSLAEQGFITFAPHNPYRGGDRFRVLQRIANPLGYSLFSIIIAQHEVILNWLQDLSFVDPSRIGFYGLSYGGKSAMRIPAVLPGYCLSICSGDFNEWIRKNASTSLPYSYMFFGEYEMPEWNLGRTFNYAEMAALIAPRPFMIEFGYFDGIGSTDWVNYEFGKVRRYYDLHGWGDRLDKEFFPGPHQIHGLGTYAFLKKHLQPERR